MTINVRVKTCGVGVNGFAFNFETGSEIKASGLGKNDFTILVAMGEAHSGDNFYVVPTKIVQAHLAKHRGKYLITPNRDRSPRKDTGRGDLRLAAQRFNPLGSGFAKKWKKYLDSWNTLDYHKQWRVLSCRRHSVSRLEVSAIGAWVRRP